MLILNHENGDNHDMGYVGAVFGDYFPKIEWKQKWTFIVCILTMLVTHLYMFTNKLPNHDDVNRLLVGDTDEVKIQHGRWAGVIFDRVSGNSASIPFVTGVISVLAVAGTAVVLVSLFHIEHRLSIVTLCGLLCTFPVSASIFMYGYIADVYFISMFLAAWGVWLLVKDKIRENLCGVALLTLSCGCYQAFWCFGIALLFLYYFMHFIELEEKWKVFCIKTAKCFGWAVLSLVVYLFVNKTVQIFTGYGATDYQGLSAMGEFGGVWNFVRVFVYTYYEFIRFFFLRGGFVGSHFMTIVNFILMVVVLFMMIRRAKVQERLKGYWVILLLWIGFIPMAFNLISIVSMNRTHALMQYTFFMPYVMCLLLLDRNAVDNGKIRITTLGLLFVVIYNGFLTVNEIYFRQQLNYEATYSYTVRLLSRIEMMEKYDPSVPVALINEKSQYNGRVKIMLENYPADMEYFSYLDAMTTIEPHTFVKKVDDIADFCKYYHGYDLKLVDTEELSNLAATEEFQDMPSYPQAGGMRYIDGVLVIKLAGGE